MFSVPTTFQKNFIDQLIDYNVYEVYGKLKHDFFGGGRPSNILPDVSKFRLEQEVKKAHQNNLEFNYLINSSCLNNKEYSRQGLKKINSFLSYLNEIKVDTLTVTIPFLAHFIKTNFPRFKIDVSTLAGVDSIAKINKWKESGADNVTLSMSANRDFKLFEQIKTFKIKDIKILVNQACEIDCIYYNYHANVTSHQSAGANRFPVEFCSLDCKYRRLTDPKMLMNTSWIRPEDLGFYRDHGISKFKIVQRQDTAEKILKTLKAYQSESYDGNLMDIATFMLDISSHEKGSLYRNFWQNIRYFFKPLTVNPQKLFQLSKMIDSNIDLYIDNQKLQGFIQDLKSSNCDLDCKNCSICNKWFKQSVTFNKEKLKVASENYSKIRKAFIDKNQNLFI